jgi:hydrogenase nickel incorporation protein HypB
MAEQKETKKIELMEDIYDENDRIAAETRASFSRRHIFAVNVMGAPGVGKTSVLRRVIAGLPGTTSYVIEGDIESDLDTKTLRSLGVEAFQINTGGACHLDSPMIQTRLKDVPLKDDSLLFIENIGNLVCPAEFQIGEHIKLLIVAVTDGSDKPYKYPLAFEKADAIVLNKCDLKPYLDFDSAFFYKGVRALNQNAPVFEVSGRTGEGFDKLVAWLRERRSSAQ